MFLQILLTILCIIFNHTTYSMYDTAFIHHYANHKIAGMQNTLYENRKALFTDAVLISAGLMCLSPMQTNIIRRFQTKSKDLKTKHGIKAASWGFTSFFCCMLSNPPSILKTLEENHELKIKIKEERIKSQSFELKETSPYLLQRFLLHSENQYKQDKLKFVPYIGLLTGSLYGIHKGLQWGSASHNKGLVLTAGTSTIAAVNGLVKTCKKYSNERNHTISLKEQCEKHSKP